jgi:three-Cys-motif partner protein
MFLLVEGLMVQQSFGGEHTNLKLGIIEKYLKAYTNVFKDLTWCKTIYIDAFAGSGEVRQKKKDKMRIDLFTEIDSSEEEQIIFKGSALRAMNLPVPFSFYKFIDNKKSNIEELENRFSNHKNLPRCDFICGDANLKILELCKGTNWKNTRAVVFLDPFGNQVAWETIEIIAATEAIDLWYLFPSGNGVFRQVPKDGEVELDSIKSIDRLYGNKDWQKLFIKRERFKDLFGENEKASRNVTPSTATELMIRQMKQVFKGGVLDQWVPLGGNKGYPEFSLVFAWANPSERACTIARRLGKAVLKASEQENGWFI